MMQARSLSFLVAIFIVFAAFSQGKITLSPSGRYFLDANRKPLFWQGDTQWELFHLFSASQAEALLRERKNQGFNFIQVMATGVFPEWGKQKGVDFTNPENAWVNGNPSEPNERYFARVDSIVLAAEKNDMILVVGIFHAQDIDKGRINMQNAKPWAKWITGRYKSASHIIWSMYPHADSLSLPFIKATLQGLREGDGGSHLITMHPDPSPKSSSFLHASSWLSFNTLQTWSPDWINYEMVISDYGKNPAKPVINGEARYEGEDGTTAFQTRRAGYWSCMAGGFYSYGHLCNWKSPLTWRKWYNSEGARQMKIMGDFFRSMPWWKLAPDQSIFVNEIKGNAACYSRDGDLVLVYLTAAQETTVRLGKLKSKHLSGWWMDPKTGIRTKAGDYNNSREYTFRLPAGWEDAVLLFQGTPD
jgi:hypothetical protein